MFFAEKVVSVWNSLPASVNFSTLCSFSFHQFSKIRINRHFHCSVIVILFCILFLFSFSMLHVLWLKVYSVSSVLVLFRAAVSAIVALLSCSRRTLYNYCHFIANLSKIKIDWLIMSGQFLIRRHTVTDSMSPSKPQSNTKDTAHAARKM